MSGQFQILSLISHPYQNLIAKAATSAYNVAFWERSPFGASTVISVNMPTPHFYRKYAHPFSEGSFLKIL